MSPFLENNFFLHEPREAKEQSTDEDFNNQQIEIEDGVKESNQKGVKDKQAQGQPEITSTRFNNTVFIFKD